MNDHRVEFTIARRLCKCRAFCRITCCGSPTCGITGEDLDGCATNLPGRLCSLYRVSMDGHVAANTHYLTSTRGSWSRLVRPNCCKKSGVVAKRAGRPTVWARPTSATRP